MVRRYCLASLNTPVLPLTALAKSACQLLEVDDERIDIAVEKLAERGEVILQSERDPHLTRVYLVNLFEAEQRVAQALAQLLTTPSSPRRTAAAAVGERSGR